MYNKITAFSGNSGVGKSALTNNIFNEEPNILINYNSKTYNVKNKEELILFEKKLDNSESLDEFYVAEYNVIYKNTDNKLFSYIRDKMIIFWLNHKSLNIFEGNYTDYLKLSGEVNSNILLEAFCINQKIYQKYKYLGLDFEECVLYRLIDSTDEKDKVIRRLYEEAEREEEKRIRREGFYGKDSSSKLRRKPRRNIYLFSLEDLDNDNIISMVESVPTYQRSKEMLDNIQAKVAGGEENPLDASDEAKNEGSGTITFG